MTSFNPKIEGIIQHNIFKEINIMDWNEYKNNIKNNFNNINFTEKIEDYIPPPGRSLYLSRQRMRSLIYNTININKNIFKEVGYDFYQPREQFNITDSNIFDFIEDCIKILVKKQQLK
jgi:hypothetical protein